MVLVNQSQVQAQPQLAELGWGDTAFTDWLLDSSGGSMRRFFSDASGSRRGLRQLPGLRAGGEGEANGHSSAASPLVQRLDVIADNFALNHQQLADVCQVSRAALYAWRGGTEPRRGALQRISALHRAALDWQRSGFPRPTATLQLPLFKQYSLLDLLCATSLDLEAIHFLGMRLVLRDTEVSAGELYDPFR